MFVLKCSAFCKAVIILCKLKKIGKYYVYCRHFWFVVVVLELSKWNYFDLKSQHCSNPCYFCWHLEIVMLFVSSTCFKGLNILSSVLSQMQFVSLSFYFYLLGSRAIRE